MTPGPSLDLRSALARLPPGDPIRSLVELSIEDDDPSLRAAVVRRLLAEIRAEKGVPRAETRAEPKEGSHAISR